MEQPNTNWKTLLTGEMVYRNESWADVVSCTLSEIELQRKFYAGYGSTSGQPFTLWTSALVYFPTEYDGAEGVSSVSRDPDGIPTDHI